MANRLAQETSPYLLQHKDNPVDWYPWGDEAFERARAEDRPILLSIGYAACHWCHVMEHESFEDADTARLMNENFVCIKVDREERPDVDAIYMDAVQAMTGHGGWPMTMFLTPAGVPFYGGTYFPPQDRLGLPSFGSVLRAVLSAWQARRTDVESQGKRLVEHIAAATTPSQSREMVTRDVIDEAARALRSAFDPQHGGFGGAPKFPQPMILDLLLRLQVQGDEAGGRMAQTTLDAMGNGGIFDQLGGGFHRYSVDPEWVVPHFEKMLYDNAQLLRTYARSWLVTGSARHRHIAEATARWMLTEMRDPAGGFWSALDADSEGVEGKFYVWTLDEVRDAAGNDAALAIANFGLSEQGNFEGANIPVFDHEVADDQGLARAREALLDRRSERPRPETDKKVLTAWNALASSALAEAGTALGAPELIAAAAEAMRFVLSRMRIDGRLMRSYRHDAPGGGRVSHLGYCEDYAFVVEACLALYEATFDLSWLDEARRTADDAIDLFWDEQGGGFFTTGHDAEELVLRPKDLIDNAIPSANSVMALELQRLTRFTGEGSYESRALTIIRLMRDTAARAPLAVGHLLQGIDFYTGDPLEIVVIGNRDRDDTRLLLDSVRTRFLPNKVLIFSDGPEEQAVLRIPLLQGRRGANGATAYVCRNGTCKLPVTDPRALVEQIESR
jgi:uncharacterized protein YyaL (SSP411 family)